MTTISNSLMNTIKMTLILTLMIYQVSADSIKTDVDYIVTSATDSEEYKNFCWQAANDSTIFENFRRDPKYQKILEHVSYQQGLEYLKIIHEKYPNLINYWDKFFGNDNVGNPVTYVYEDIGQASPTTLRYVKILGDLEDLFGDISGKTIIEIGGGYGGQCKILCDKFTPEEYTIVDLKESLALVETYLDVLQMKETNSINLISSEEAEAKECDIFISNYSFSECNSEVQKEYLEKYIFRSSAGYMIFNTWEGLPFQTYSSEDLCDILVQNGFDVYVTPEEPLTSPQNLLFVWYKN